MGACPPCLCTCESLIELKMRAPEEDDTDLNMVTYLHLLWSTCTFSRTCRHIRAKRSRTWSGDLGHVTRQPVEV